MSHSEYSYHLLSNIVSCGGVGSNIHACSIRLCTSSARLSLIDYWRETLYGYFMPSPVCSLSSYIFQFLFHLLPAHLCIAYRCLNGGRPFLCDMPEVVGHFFKRPACFSCSVGEVVS